MARDQTARIGDANEEEDKDIVLRVKFSRRIVLLLIRRISMCLAMATVNDEPVPDIYLLRNYSIYREQILSINDERVPERRAWGERQRHKSCVRAPLLLRLCTVVLSGGISHALTRFSSVSYALQVRIIQAYNLPNKEASATKGDCTDCYVKVQSIFFLTCLHNVHARANVRADVDAHFFRRYLQRLFFGHTNRRASCVEHFVQVFSLLMNQISK